MRCAGAKAFYSAGKCTIDSEICHLPNSGDCYKIYDSSEISLEVSGWRGKQTADEILEDVKSAISHVCGNGPTFAESMRHGAMMSQIFRIECRWHIMMEYRPNSFTFRDHLKDCFGWLT